MTQSAETRSFSVHARHDDSHHASVVREASFEAAAVAYAEDLPVPDTERDEVSLIVRDVETGHEHCFTVDLAGGEAVACS